MITDKRHQTLGQTRRKFLLSESELLLLIIQLSLQRWLGFVHLALSGLSGPRGGYDTVGIPEWQIPKKVWFSGVEALMETASCACTCGADGVFRSSDNFKAQR